MALFKHCDVHWPFLIHRMYMEIQLFHKVVIDNVEMTNTREKRGVVLNFLKKKDNEKYISNMEKKQISWQMFLFKMSIKRFCR